MSTSPDPLPFPEKTWLFDAEVIALPHDGDTLLVRADVGFRIDYRPTIRLEGVYMPELSEPGGYEARAALWALVPPASWVRIRTVLVKNPQPVSKFKESLDRFIATIWRLSDRLDINAEMRRLPAGGIGAR